MPPQTRVKHMLDEPDLVSPAGRTGHTHEVGPGVCRQNGERQDVVRVLRLHVEVNVDHSGLAGLSSKASFRSRMAARRGLRSDCDFTRSMRTRLVVYQSMRSLPSLRWASSVRSLRCSSYSPYSAGGFLNSSAALLVAASGTSSSWRVILVACLATSNALPSASSDSFSARTLSAKMALSTPRNASKAAWKA